MSLKKKLLTYNSIKNPIVDDFFNSLDKGMQSHYMREAIEFYMQHKDSLNTKTPSESFLKASEGANVDSNTKAREEAKELSNGHDSNYEDGDLTNI